jgi:hypothetical protein
LADETEGVLTFRKSLPLAQHDLAVIIKLDTGHSNTLERLKASLAAEREQHRLILKQALAEADAQRASTSGERSSSFGKCFVNLFPIVSAKRKGKKAKANRFPPSPPSMAGYDEHSNAEFDRRISALERDNAELKQDNTELKRDNIELKDTVDRVSTLSIFNQPAFKFISSY